jgi:hypothetical protein
MAFSSFTTMSNFLNKKSEIIKPDIPFNFPIDFSMNQMIKTNAIDQYVSQENFKNVCSLNYTSINASSNFSRWGDSSWAIGKYFFTCSNMVDRTHPRYPGYLFNKININSLNMNDGYWLGAQNNSHSMNVTMNSTENDILFNGTLPTRFSGSLYSTTTGMLITNTPSNVYTITTNVSGTNIFGEFIQVKFPFKFVIKNVWVSGTGWSFPKNVTIVGSNDNITWSNVSSVTNLSNNTDTTREIQIFTNINNNIAYFYHRIIIQAINDNQGKAGLSHCRMSGFARV